MSFRICWCDKCGKETKIPIIIEVNTLILYEGNYPKNKNNFISEKSNLKFIDCEDGWITIVKGQEEIKKCKFGFCYSCYEEYINSNQDLVILKCGDYILTEKVEFIESSNKKYNIK